MRISYFLSLIIYFFLFLSQAHAITELLVNGDFEQNSGAWASNYCHAAGAAGGNGSPGTVSGCSDALDETEQKLTGWTITGSVGGTTPAISTTGETYAGNLDWAKYINRDCCSGVTETAYPQSGTYFLEIYGNRGSGVRFSQTIATNPNKRHRLVIHGRSSNGYNNTRRSVLIYICSSSSCSGGNSYTLYPVNSNGSSRTMADTHREILQTSSWGTYYYDFIPQTSSTFISFENVPANNSVFQLDNMSVYELPSLYGDSKTYVYDPGHQELKAVPGNDMVFMYSLENRGISPDSGSLAMRFNIPSTMSFKVDSFTYVDGETVGSSGYDPLFDGAGASPSNLTCGLTEVSYSNDGLSFGYTPQNIYQNDFGEWYDPDVRAIRIMPTGTMSDGTSSPSAFRVYYQAQVK